MTHWYFTQQLSLESARDLSGSYCTSSEVAKEVSHSDKCHLYQVPRLVRGSISATLLPSVTWGDWAIALQQRGLDWSSNMGKRVRVRL